MARISYVNGRYLPHAQAAVHIEDRGYQFADGVYEVMAFYNRRFLDEDPHLRRLQRSLSELSITMPLSLAALKLVMREVVARNRRDHGTLYMQITRGVAKRYHDFPKDVRPAIVMTVNAIRIPSKEETIKGVALITYPENRWSRRDIKSISLLANVLAKQAASEAGAREALLVDTESMVTEGSSSNAYIVTQAGELITHPLASSILGGITREDVVAVARQERVKLAERRFSLQEAYDAAEMFVTSTSINILPVVRLDGKEIGCGKPGKVTMALLERYLEHIEAQTGFRP